MKGLVELREVSSGLGSQEPNQFSDSFIFLLELLQSQTFSQNVGRVFFDFRLGPVCGTIFMNFCVKRESHHLPKNKKMIHLHVQKVQVSTKKLARKTFWAEDEPKNLELV